MATTATHTQQFALKWNNFHSNLSSGFHELFEAADMVDVTLAVDGKFLQAHKVVLSICSPYFKEMFKVNPCKHPIVILKDVGHDHMKDILEFMYLGEVSVMRENLTSFLRTAELLQVKGLTGDDPSDSSKEDEKIDCDNEEEDYSSMMQNMQYNQQFQSADNKMGITQHYSASSTQSLIAGNLTPPPQVLPVSNINVPQPLNHKRFPKSSTMGGGNGKRTKIDNNSNQSLANKLIPMQTSLEEDILNHARKNMNSVGESEYTDISNIKSERPAFDEECLERNLIDKDKSTSLDGLVDQAKCDACGKCMRKSSLRRHMFDVHHPTQQLPCLLCQKRFKTANSLTTHLITIHRQFKSNRETTRMKR